MKEIDIAWLEPEIVSKQTLSLIIGGRPQITHTREFDFFDPAPTLCTHVYVYVLHAFHAPSPEICMIWRMILLLSHLICVRNLWTTRRDNPKINTNTTHLLFSFYLSTFTYFHQKLKKGNESISVYMTDLKSLFWVSGYLNYFLNYMETGIAM